MQQYHRDASNLFGPRVRVKVEPEGIQRQSRPLYSRSAEHCEFSASHEARQRASACDTCHVRLNFAARSPEFRCAEPRRKATVLFPRTVRRLPFVFSLPAKFPATQDTFRSYSPFAAPEALRPVLTLNATETEASVLPENFTPAR